MTHYLPATVYYWRGGPEDGRAPEMERGMEAGRAGQAGPVGGAPAPNDYDDADEFSAVPSPGQQDVRVNFPESWIWIEDTVR